MPLSNAQYDEIMHEYDERQLHNRHILETRRAEVLKKLPRLKEIDASVASSSVRQARLHLDGDTNALASLKQELSALSLERQQLLTASGYPADYLDPVYTCPDCKDSGYIDGEALFWKDGCLFSVKETQDENPVTFNLPSFGPGDEMPDYSGVRFDAEKWRSGLGAYFFTDCTAVRNGGGQWGVYTVGAEAIA